MAKCVLNILELVGDTPIVRLNRLTGPKDATIWAKLEAFNPMSSVKDRICLAMIRSAEAEGKLNKGMTIVEPTSGNTGIGLAMVATVKGYRLILTMPDTNASTSPSVCSRISCAVVCRCTSGFAALLNCCGMK